MQVAQAQFKAHKIARSWEAILEQRFMLQRELSPAQTSICGLGCCENNISPPMADLTSKCGSMLTLWEGLHGISMANVNYTILATSSKEMS